MSTVVVWFLVISYYRGGTVAIPQQSQQDCQAQAAWVVSAEAADAYSSRPVAYCVRGVKP